eukprot:scaffold43478_cov63-Phaeocystis_antarctica.AAC.9
MRGCVVLHKDDSADQIGPLFSRSSCSSAARAMGLLTLCSRSNAARSTGGYRVAKAMGRALAGGL